MFKKINISLLPGDGIGKEVSNEALKSTELGKQQLKLRFCI